MVSQLRLALLIGAITAVAVSPARANFWRSNGCCDPCPNPCANTAPQFRTVTCTEWVRENYTTTRKAYRTECRTETYQTCRTECVPVCREKTVCVQVRVPVVREECRKVCHKVTTCEERLVNKTCYRYEQRTCMKKELVRLGHWECHETCGFGGFGLGNGGFLGGRGCGCGHRGHGDCCNDSCNNNCCNDSCRPTRTRKVWVHCPEYRECPHTTCVKVPYCVQVKCNVQVCRNEWREEKVKVCTHECRTEQRVCKYTCYETRTVPCTATRTVRVCVPYEETVTCCRMVPRTVCRQV